MAQAETRSTDTRRDQMRRLWDLLLSDPDRPESGTKTSVDEIDEEVRGDHVA